MNKFLDLKWLLKNFDEPNITCKPKKSNKGNSVFATKFIKKGNIVAYYKFKVYRDSTFKSKSKNVYIMTVYTKSGKSSDVWIGDVGSESMELAKRKIPFWGYLLNEPSLEEEEN